MKKTISINLNGQVFNIEEDGYDTLRNYLVSITNYFSNYAGSKEILSDIEGRIAEKFYENMVKSGTQVITKENVDQLVLTMGSTTDFEAFREEVDLIEKGQNIDLEPSNIDTAQHEKFQSAIENNTKTKFYRNGKQKSIAGVASGLAHYFKVDVIWVRLAFICAVLFVPIWENFNLEILAGASILLYIACWAAFPIRNDIEENPNIKKLYRDHKNKVISGVASGIATYLNIDVSLVRLIFIISIFFFGFGLLVYIAIWLVTPFAQSITQKMQMKGEAITLNNIEKAVSQNNFESTHTETTLAKLFLFPFRLLGKIINGILPIFKSFGAILRVLFGGTISFTAIVSIIAFVISFVALLGIFGYSNVKLGNLPVENFLNEVPRNSLIMALFVVLIPFIGLLYLGISLIKNKNYFQKNGVITMGAIWFISLLALGNSVKNFKRNFNEEQTVVAEQIYDLKNHNLTVIYEKVGNRKSNYDNVNIKFLKSLDNKYKVIKKITAFGSTEKEAIQNAQTLKYDVKFEKDSVLSLPESIALARNEKFRKQSVVIEIYVPVNRMVNVAENVAWSSENLGSTDQGLFFRNDGFEKENFYQFKMTENGFENPKNEYNAALDKSSGKFSQIVPIEMFNSVKIEGDAEVIIEYSEEQNLEIQADSKNAISEIRDDVRVEDSNLSIQCYDKSNVKLIIKTPFLRNLFLGNNIKMEVDAKQDRFKELNINVEGQSELSWMGNIDKLNLKLVESAKVNMDNTTILKLNVETNNESSLKLKTAITANVVARESSKVEFLIKPKVLNSKNEGENSKILVLEK